VRSALRGFGINGIVHNMANILVVDDEVGIREFIAEALENQHATVTAPDAEAALRELGARGFDLMLTDLKMPGMSGLTLLERAKEMQPDLEVIVLTAHGTVSTAVEAIKKGAFDFLQKPVSGPEELRLLAARALERRRLLAEKESREREPESLPLTYGDPTMASVVATLKKVARTEATVLLCGESGTGKEVAARALHSWSARSQGPFVAINCAALSDNLLESELFGHEKGAFTGASAARRGRIELAAQGSFFLDEVDELKPELQAKLLRVLQEKTFDRLGGSRTLTADVRWIAATNRDLLAMVKAGQFREDLYHRLAVFPIELPPLRERRDDILPLARALLARVATSVGRRGLALSADAERSVVQGEWSGNVRELANALERAAIVCEGSEVTPENLDPTPVWRSKPLALGQTLGIANAPGDSNTETLESVERRAIERALAAVDGNRRRAAEQLGIGERTLYDKLKRYGL
jgi:two-component system response regulator AtoC